MKLTYKQVKEELAELNVSIRREIDTNEYRVNHLLGTEETAYYATDLEDALGTGRLMSKPVDAFNSDLMKVNNSLADAIHKLDLILSTQPIKELPVWRNRETALRELKLVIEQMIEDKESKK